MSKTVERLLAAARSMPEPLLNEVLDFAEFLNARCAARSGKAPGVRLHDLCGGLEGSVAFAGPVNSIQRQLRDEWH